MCRTGRGLSLSREGIAVKNDASMLHDWDGEPLDWTETLRPARWRFGEEIHTFKWQ